MLACIGIYVRILWYVYIFVPLTGQLLSDLSVATSDPKVERSQHPTSSASPATHTEGACQLYKPWRKHIGVVHCCCFGVRIWLLWFDFFFFHTWSPHPWIWRTWIKLLSWGPGIQIEIPHLPVVATLDFSTSLHRPPSYIKICHRG